jgi:predicted methyltransferase
MKYLLMGAAALAIVACGDNQPAQTEAPADETAASEDVVEEAVMTAEEKLDAVLAAQDEDTKARYQYRHPKETLMFFGIEPGMTVVDSLPGTVWYSGILSDYLGPDGKVIGADYSMEMWPLFGGFATEEWLANRANWKETYVANVNETRDEDDAPVEAFVYGSLPEEMYGTADVVMMVRAAHHFNRFEDEHGFFTQALEDVSNVLKPGGTLGVIQHRAPEGNSDEWSTGDNGYVKQSRIISFVEAHGFELVDTSEINANPNDQPTEDDIVWRLPPTLGTSGEDPELRAQMETIGESDRMTLKFRKAE